MEKYDKKELEVLILEQNKSYSFIGKLYGVSGNAIKKVAKKLGIQGQAVTPYLLQRLYEITEGESLKTNIELVKNNAVLCTKIAVAFFKH